LGAAGAASASDIMRPVGTMVVIVVSLGV